MAATAQALVDAASALGVSASRLMPPALGDDVAMDAALLERVCQAVAANRVTVVSGPAGAGKTTILAAVARRSARPVAWLRVGATEDSGDRLARLLGTVIHLAVPDATPSLREIVHASRSPGVVEVLSMAGNDLLRNSAEVLVVVDDTHVLTDRSLLGELATAIRDLPGQLRLLLGGRAVPDVGLAGVRGRGRVALFGPEDLRLGTAQVRALMARGGVDTQAVGEVTAQCAGLPAVVHLWIETARARSGGRGEVIYDFLADELLTHLDPADADFLLRISILHDITVSAAEALTDRADAGARLHRLHRDHHFLLREGGEVERYRMHDLFADFLQRHLQRLDAAQLRELHRRAGHVVDDVDQAIGHLLAADDEPAALAVLADRTRDHLMQPAEMRRLAPWAEELQHLGSPWTALVLGSVAFHSGQVGSAVAHLGDLWRQFDRDTEPLAHWVAAWMDSRISDGNAAIEWLHEQDDPVAVIADLPFALQRYLREYPIIMGLFGGDLAAASAHARRFLIDGHIGATAHLAIPEVGPVAAACDPRPPQTPTEEVHRDGWLLARDHYLGLGEAAVEEVRWVQTLGELPPTFWIEQHAVRIGTRLQAGRWQDVVDAVDEAVATGDRWTSAYRHALEIAVARPLRILRDTDRLSDLVDALARPSMMQFGPEHSAALQATARVELHWAEGRLDDAATDAGAAVAAWASHPFHGVTGLPHLTLAAVRHAQGRATAAREALAAGLHIAARDHLYGLAAWGGPVLVEVLEDAVTAGIGVDAARRILALVGRVDDPRAVRAREIGLSARETEVLVLIAEGASNAQLAEHLVVSMNTVKTHVRNLMRKLGATSRTHAVAIAREHGIV